MVQYNYIRDSRNKSYSSLLLLGMVQWICFNWFGFQCYSSLLLLGMVQYRLHCHIAPTGYSSLLLLGMVQFIPNPAILGLAIVPFYFWVWYNQRTCVIRIKNAIVPFYFWVWYNRHYKNKSC